jgi:cytochrome c553
LIVAVTGGVKTLLFVFFLVLIPLVPVTAVIAKRLTSRRPQHAASGRDAATPFRVITWVGGTVTAAVFVVLLIVLGAQRLASDGGDNAVDPRKGNESPVFSDPADTQAVQGDAAAGKSSFVSSKCGDCHTLADAEARGSSAPSLDEGRPDFAAVIACLTTGPGEMPVFSGRLNAAEIRNVAKYVSTVAGR